MRRLAILFAAFFAVRASFACDFETARKEGRSQLRETKLSFLGSAKYRQYLRLPNGHRVPLGLETDYKYREVGFAVLNIVTCKVDVLVVFRAIKDQEVSGIQGKDGFKLEPRVFGPIWNGINTQTTFADSAKVTVGEKWKVYGRDEYVYSVPYSLRLHLAFPELIAAGREHVRADTEAALAYLRERIPVPPAEEERARRLTPRLVAVETIDPNEFKWSNSTQKEILADKPYVYFGANGDDTMSRKVSTKKAIGPAQIWAPTCRDVRANFSEVGMGKDCNDSEGVTHKHIKNLAASILVQRMKFDELAEHLDADVLNSAEGDRFIAASYNGGAGYVRKAVAAYGEAWDIFHSSKNSILEETVDYLPKFDFLTQCESLRKAENTIIASGAR